MTFRIFNEISSYVLFEHKSCRSWRMTRSQFLCLTSTRPPSKGFSPGLLSIRCALDLDYFPSYLCENLPSYFCENLPLYLSDIFVIKEEKTEHGSVVRPVRKGSEKCEIPPCCRHLQMVCLFLFFKHFHLFVCLFVCLFLSLNVNCSSLLSALAKGFTSSQRMLGLQILEMCLKYFRTL